MVSRHQQRQERLAAPRVAADRQRAQRVAVIALTPRDEVPALRLADFNEVLACSFSAASIASEPPETKYTWSRSPGAAAARRAASSSATSVVKNDVCA